jgi:hypothetical protein
LKLFPAFTTRFFRISKELKQLACGERSLTVQSGLKLFAAFDNKDYKMQIYLGLHFFVFCTFTMLLLKL